MPEQENTIIQFKIKLFINKPVESSRNNQYNTTHKENLQFILLGLLAKSSMKKDCVARWFDIFFYIYGKILTSSGKVATDN